MVFRTSRRRVGIRLFALLAMLTTTTAVALAAAAPAQASATAMQRCLSGAAPNETQTVTHYGNQAASSFPNAVDPPNAIWPGDVVKVTAIGSITNAPWPFGGWFGPAGNSIPAGPEFPFPGLNEYSSVARWNAQGSGWVGDPMHTVSLSACVYAPSIRVRLIYQINDNVLWDNGGAFTITTKLYYGP